MCNEFLKMSPFNSKLRFYRVTAKELFYCRYFSQRNDAVISRPYVNFDHIFANFDQLGNSIKYRNLPNNVMNLQYWWSVIKKYDHYKRTMKENLTILHRRVSYLKEKQPTLQEDIQACVTHVFIIRKNLKLISAFISELEKIVLSECALLPNELHKDTPLHINTVIYASTPKVTKYDVAGKKHHLVIGEDLKLIRYISPVIYYLLGDAATFEVAVLKFVSIEMENNGYTPMCNTDILTYFDKCYNSDIHVALVGKLVALQLQGAASVSSICAFRSKCSVNIKFTPERHYTIGQQFSLANARQNALYNNDGLYTVVQRSVAQFFIAVSDLDKVTDEFNDILNITKKIYSMLGLDFRIIYVNASELKLWESLRADIQLYSLYKKEYVNVGYISLCTNYISKRLFIYGHNKASKHEFLNVITGTVLNVPVLLACLLEYCENDATFTIPNCVVPYFYNRNVATKEFI